MVGEARSNFTMPDLWPTHRHQAEFWESLGRVIGTFGCLEQVIGKAIYVFIMTKRYPEHEAKAAAEEGIKNIQNSVGVPLADKANRLRKFAKCNPENVTLNIDEICDNIVELAQIRNVLCHGSWDVPEEDGASTPFFIKKHNKSDVSPNVFKGKIDIKYLDELRDEVVDLICEVRQSVILMGYKLPGVTNDPGIKI